MWSKEYYFEPVLRDAALVQSPEEEGFWSVYGINANPES